MASLGLLIIFVSIHVIVHQTPWEGLVCKIIISLISGNYINCIPHYLPLEGYLGTPGGFNQDFLHGGGIPRVGDSEASN